VAGIELREEEADACIGGVCVQEYIYPVTKPVTPPTYCTISDASSCAFALLSTHTKSVTIQHAYGSFHIAKAGRETCPRNYLHVSVQHP
jgi:hypothetical protein